MTATQLTTLASGVADALAAGVRRSDIQQIVNHPAARDSLLHAATKIAMGEKPNMAELRQIVFALPGHGGVGLKLA